MFQLSIQPQSRQKNFDYGNSRRKFQSKTYQQQLLKATVCFAKLKESTRLYDEYPIATNSFKIPE